MGVGVGRVGGKFWLSFFFFFFLVGHSFSATLFFAAVEIIPPALDKREMEIVGLIVVKEVYSR